jgi:hypothetical protein
VPTYIGTWTARVEQDFEIEADSEEEAMKLLQEEMSPHNVVELLDIEVSDIDEDEE